MNTTMTDGGARPAPPSKAIPTSAASWPAIVAGAITAAAISLILLVLGTGLGLLTISPGSAGGASLGALGVASILWMILMSALASGLGGYLAGRLRTRWIGADANEVYFRDTAHGLLTWSLATLVTAALLTYALTSIAGGASRAGTEALQAWSASKGPSADEYYVDKLLRHNTPGDGDRDYALNMEVSQILAAALRRGALEDDDRRYLVALITNVAAINSAQAEQRVEQLVGEAIFTAHLAQSTARDAADTLSTQTAKLSLWIFVALLIGAFCGSYAATFGGRQRDRIDA